MTCTSLELNVEIWALFSLRAPFLDAGSSLYHGTSSGKQQWRWRWRWMMMVRDRETEKNMNQQTHVRRSLNELASWPKTNRSRRLSLSDDIYFGLCIPVKKTIDFTPRFKLGWLVPIAILFIILFPPVNNSALFCQLYIVDYISSCLDMKSLLFYVVLSGDCGLVLLSSLPAPSLAKLATFSTLISSYLFNLLIFFAVLSNTAVTQEERNLRKQRSGMHAWHKLCVMVVLKLLSSPVWVPFPVTVSSSSWKYQSIHL